MPEVNVPELSPKANQRPRRRRLIFLACSRDKVSLEKSRRSVWAVGSGDLFGSWRTGLSSEPISFAVSSQQVETF